MDFSEKPQVDISAIAGVLQRKAAQQAQMDEQGNQMRSQMVQQAVQGAAAFTNQLIQNAKQQHTAAFVKDLADARAAEVPQLQQTLPQQGPGLPTMDNGGVQTPTGAGVAGMTSQFPNAQGYATTSAPTEAPLPPVQTQVPDYAKMRAIRAATMVDPKASADATIKGMSPNNSASGWDMKPVLMPDGTIGYANINKITGEVKPVVGVQGTGVTPAQREKQLEIGQQNADTRETNAGTNQSRFVTVTGNKFADATDVTKMADYSRLTAAKRLNQFVDQIKDSATGFQMKEASSLLASILQGGGKGTPIAEKLIDQMTPSTVKGTALQKLEWLTNNPTSVDQGKFLELMATTGQRESVAAEDNLRQHQVEAVKKYGDKVKGLDKARYDSIISSIGIDPEKNIDAQGRFIRTPEVRSLLPNYNDVAHGASKGGSTKKGVDLGGGFSYTVK